MPLARLPLWAIDNVASVREEARPYVGQNIHQRWDATRRCCRAATALLRFHRDRERALQYSDPLPESSQQALARLRLHHAAPTP